MNRVRGSNRRWMIAAAALALVAMACTCGPLRLIDGELVLFEGTPTPTPVPPPPPEEATPEATPQPTGNVLQYGESVTGTITDNDPRSTFTFNGTAGQIVAITMERLSGDLDSYLQLIGPDGEVLTEDDDSGGELNARIWWFALPEDGTYTIVATRYGEAEGATSGEFRLTLREGQSQSNSLGYGDQVTGELSDAHFEDYWVFEGTAGDLITISMERTSGDLDSYLLLLDPAGRRVAEDDDSGGELNARIGALALPEDGSYTIIATRLGGADGTGSGEYLLTLDLVPPEDTTPVGSLRYGESVNGEISHADYSDYWTFEGEQGDVVIITMMAENTGLDSYLSLLGPDGAEIASDDDSAGELNALLIVPLPASGTYTILATRFGHIAGTSEGSYRLSLQRAEQLRTISPGQTVTGQITESEPFSLWRLEGTSGDVVSISMTALEGGLDPYLQLIAPSGNVLVADDDSGGNLNALIAGVELPEDGTYLIVATRYGGTGRFELGVTAGQSSPEAQSNTGGGTIRYGETVSGSITAGRYEERWTFQAQAGEVISIAMDQTSGDLDCLLVLLGPDGEELTSDDDSGDNYNSLIEGYRLPVSGTYTIVATRYNGSGGSSTGSYTLTLLTGSPAQNTQAGSISYGQTVTGQISSIRRAERWAFQGTAGDVVIVTMEGTGGELDTFLVLLDPNGDEIAYNDDSGPSLNSRLYSQLPESGTYTIVASRYSGSGSYTLTLERARVRPISAGQTVSGQLPPANPHEFWAFEGEAGDRVTITLERTDGSFQPALWLLGPEGNELTFSEEASGGRASIVSYPLPIDGSYVIVAGAAGGRGGYRLTLESQ